ncbi:MAG: DMT family transporter [Parvibaculaceae bacterium]
MSASRPVLGVVLMAVAMLAIPTVDGIAKHLSAGHSPLFLSWARYLVACLAVLPAAAVLHRGKVFPSERLGSHALRTVFLVASMSLYFLAIARIPLATAASTYFVAPVIAVALSTLLLKERLSWPKVASLALGFAGSMVILKPGGGFDPGILLALGSGILFAFYLIATRRASQGSDPLKTLAFQCVVGALLLTPQAVFTWSQPSLADLPFFLALGVLSALCHLLTIAAFRFADASALAPLVYCELIGAALIGYFAFGEVPGVTTLLGAGLIVAAGLLLLRRPASSLPS